jgi:hypothetical protein
MKAWIENGVVRDVVADPSVFTPSIASLYTTDVPDGTVNGASFVDGEWVNPVAQEPEEPVVVTPVSEPKIVSPVEFKLLFTSPERIAIKAARATDPVIDDFYELLDDPRLSGVNLGLQSIQDAVGYMALQGLIAPERVAVILSGDVV